jgi:hypothetical protein
MDDFDSSFFLLRALAGPAMALVTMLVTLTIFAPIVMYVVARWRAAKDPDTDRHLGLKVALHYFAITAFQMGLAALTLLVWAMITTAPSEMKSVFYRVAFGMLMPAGLVFAAHLSLLKRTNDAERTSVRRLFGGYNLIVTGLIGFIALVIAFQALFAKGSSGEMGRAAGAMVLVYGTAWAIVGWRFGMQVLTGGPGSTSASPPQPGSSASPPPAAPASTPTPPASAAPTTGGLPSLGGGAFPPIEPKS